MRRARILALALVGLLPAVAGKSLHEPVHEVTLELTHLSIPMRDGIKLAADLYQAANGGHLPTVLLRTPYNKEARPTETRTQAQFYADRGYNVLWEDVRGRFASEGVFTPFWQEAPDGDDTINWIAAQPWSDGQVVMTGGSYLGIAQWKVAVWNNPHLKAIFPVVSGDDDYRDRFYSPGGALKWGHRLEWVAENLRAPGYEPPKFDRFIWTEPERHVDFLLTGRTSSFLELAFDHPSDDSFWKKISVREKLEGCRVPEFAVGGWFDNYVESDLDAFTQLRKHSTVDRLMIGPWPHNIGAQFTTIDYGATAHVPLDRIRVPWFDEWTKSKNVRPENVPPLRLFVMGINEWRDENEWPLARAIPTRFYLHSRGHANSLDGDGALLEHPEQKTEEDRFTYDPHNPVPTMGGAVCCNNKVFPWGPMDQRPVEKRHDVLVYTTEPLREDLEVTGPISLVLYASSSAPDTDFTAKLVDVYPDGRAMNLTDGVLRTRYRGGLEKPKLLTNLAMTKYTIDAGVTANVFRRGHRIRLEVSSSNFPRFDRNPNTGRAIADETQIVKAAQTIYHDRGHRSYLLLPIAPPQLPAAVTRLTEPKL